MTTKRLGVAFTILLSWLVASATPVSAQSYADLVWEQLKTAYTWADNEGYSTRNYIVGNLDDGATDTWTLTFYQGNSYLIVGACDGDCLDIDMALQDANGVNIDSDTLEDDQPVLRVTPGSTADFSVEVTMYDCRVDPCYFGFGIFVK